jgi:hypothetical protein
LKLAASTPSVSSSGTMRRASAGVSMRVGRSHSFCVATLFSRLARMAGVRARKR